MFQNVAVGAENVNDCAAGRVTGIQQGLNSSVLVLIQAVVSFHEFQGVDSFADLVVGKVESKCEV